MPCLERSSGGKPTVKNSTQLEGALARFLPEGSLELACNMLREYPHHLVITEPRSTKLGDFTPSLHGRHQLTVNGNLNPYAFLITLMHELAHLMTFLEHKNSVKPHGQEWKLSFKKTLSPFLLKEIFPKDVEAAIAAYLKNPAATTCSDLRLSKALANYDKSSHPNIKLIDDVPAGTRFLYGRDKRVFFKKVKIRTRYRCIEEKTGHEYLFHPLVKVFVLERE
jgi:SprT protein